MSYQTPRWKLVLPLCRQPFLGQPRPLNLLTLVKPELAQMT